MKTFLKKNLILILSMAIVLSFNITSESWAEDVTIVDSGNCGIDGADNCQWSLDSKGKLTVTGSGATDNYTYNELNGHGIYKSPWSTYQFDITSVDVSGISTIGKGAFGFLPNLKDVYIADSVTKLENDAFWDSPIETLRMSDSVTTMYNGALYGNHLTSLDVSNNIALTILICHSNRLKSLSVRKNTALMTLDCSSNQLASLDVSKNVTLTSLKCSSNKLMALDVSNNTDLSMLECAQNNLISLDVSKNTALTGLNCSSNQLTTLDLRMNKALTVLICYSNMIKTVDLTKNKEIKWQQVGDTIIQK